MRYVARETYDQTAYAAVCEGEAVCGGIADAYVYLLERGGIPARVVTGTSQSADGTADSHAWVAAELDGAVYYFDPTWDLQDDESEACLLYTSPPLPHGRARPRHEAHHERVGRRGRRRHGDLHRQ